MKGTSRRIVVVKSPDPKIFEQAIFIVREDAGLKGGECQNDILKQAQAIASEYIKGSQTMKGRMLSKVPPAAYAAAGAGLTGVVWLVLRFTGI